MLSYFPQIRPEESTYSIFSRLQFALQPSDLTFMGALLFNRTKEVGRLNFQNSFDYLCSNLTSFFTPELFFYNNTIFPLFIPFISTEKQQQALEYFKGVYPGKINNYLVLSNVTSHKTYIRICKECFKEDIYTYGEPYYHRQHEIELNRLCYKHLIPLHEYIISDYSIPRRYEDYLTVVNSSSELKIPNKFTNKFLDISRDINAIFTSNLVDWNINITQHKIMNRLKERKYISVNGYKFGKQFCMDFKDYYTEDFLNYIGFNFDITLRENWLMKAIGSRPDNNPLKFILLIQFLFGSFKYFYEYNKEINLFANGLYPCLNVVCPNYNKLVIKDIAKISKFNSSYQTATFKCEHCGSIYYRRISNSNYSDIYSKTYIKERGHLWHRKLKDLVDNGVSFKEISKTLNCTASFARTLYSRRNTTNNVHNSNTGLYNKSRLKNTPDKLSINNYKKQVLNLINDFPSTNRSTLFNLNQNIYRYLLVNESEWLSSVLPIPSKNKFTSKDDTLIKFWKNKDELLSKKILAEIDNIKSERSPHRKISNNLICKKIGYKNFYTYKDKLPKCCEILDKNCEITLEYQKRRVKHAIKKMDDEKIKVTVSKVLKSASLDKFQNTNCEILSYVQVMVSEYNNGDINITNNTDK